MTNNGGEGDSTWHVAAAFDMGQQLTARGKRRCALDRPQPVSSRTSHPQWPRSPAVTGERSTQKNNPALATTGSVGPAPKSVGSANDPVCTRRGAAAAAHGVRRRH